MLTNTSALLPSLPYHIRKIVSNWTRRGVPAGVKAVIENEQLYQALRADLTTQHKS